MKWGILLEGPPGKKTFKVQRKTGAQRGAEGKFRGGLTTTSPHNQEVSFLGRGAGLGTNRLREKAGHRDNVGGGVR